MVPSPSLSQQSYALAQLSSSQHASPAAPRPRSAACGRERGCGCRPPGRSPRRGRPPRALDEGEVAARWRRRPASSGRSGGRRRTRCPRASSGGLPKLLWCQVSRWHRPVEALGVASSPDLTRLRTYGIRALAQGEGQQRAGASITGASPVAGAGWLPSRARCAMEALSSGERQRLQRGRGGLARRGVQQQRVPGGLRHREHRLAVRGAPHLVLALRHAGDAEGAVPRCSRNTTTSSPGEKRGQTVHHLADIPYPAARLGDEHRAARLPLEGLRHLDFHVGDDAAAVPAPAALHAAHGALDDGVGRWGQLRQIRAEHRRGARRQPEPAGRRPEARAARSGVVMKVTLGARQPYPMRLRPGAIAHTMPGLR